MNIDYKSAVSSLEKTNKRVSLRYIFVNFGSNSKPAASSDPVKFAFALTRYQIANGGIGAFLVLIFLASGIVKSSTILVIVLLLMVDPVELM